MIDSGADGDRHPQGVHPHLCGSHAGLENRVEKSGWRFSATMDRACISSLEAKAHKSVSMGMRAGNVIWPSPFQITTVGFVSSGQYIESISSPFGETKRPIYAVHKSVVG
jgi:hypothetical protein